MNTYFANHNHTEYSNALLGFPDVVNKTEELIQKAYDLGLAGLAINEHEGISSAIRAFKYFNSMQKDRDFKIAFGNEIYLMSEQENLDNQDKDIDSYTPYYHFVLTALDTEGHKQIRELSCRAWKRAYTYKGLMRRPTYYTDIEEIIGDNKGHVISSTACLGSYLDRMILKWKNENDDSYKEYIHDFIQWGINTFGKDNFYLEIQPCNDNNKDQMTVNETMWILSEAYGLKIIATTDAHYLSKDTAFVHRTYLNSKDGDREVDEFYSTAYLMGADELRKYLKLQFTDEQIDLMFQNSLTIQERVQEYQFQHTPSIPHIPYDKIPDFKITHRYKDYYHKFEYFNNYAYTENILDKYFFYRIENSLYKLIEQKGKDLELYIDRLNKEMGELQNISAEFNESMASYYTSMSRIVELIWETDNLSMPSRGSGMGYVICYLLEITQIDPVPLGEYAPHWRHLSIERGAEIPDIDNDAPQLGKENIVEAIKNEWGEDKVVAVATFSGLTSKTAIEKSCKGLGLSDDIAGYLKSLIPVERGFIWSLKDCLQGNEEKGRKPVAELVREINEYEHLKECALALEGLIVGRGQHAAAVLISNEPYVNTIACMKAPSGKLTSCYDLHDADFCGQVKFDMLTIIASDKIRTTMDLLIQYGHMEYQGSLKDTYWKYLHPDVLEYSEPKMWDKLQQVYSVFQFDTDVSVKALNMTNPRTVMDLSTANSLMRLMTQEGQEPPMDKYVRYKSNINEWFEDMADYGLNTKEQTCLREHLETSYGLAESQEKVMLISMDKRVSGFSLGEANKLRKSIAKKSPKVLAETKKLFFKKGEEQNTRKKFLDYVWNVIFAISFGYSFSQLHSYAYSVIALQELNLNYYYPPVYWNTANLRVIAATDNESASKNTDYGEIARAIYKMKTYDINVLPPSINKSEVTFTPNEENNTILFGLGGIAGINIDIAKQIVSRRPYDSFQTFYDIHKDLPESLIKKSKFITLIKAGCFDEFGVDRCELMRKLCSLENPNKTSLTTANVPSAIAIGVKFPENLIRTYNFRKYVLNKSNIYCTDPKFKSKKHYILESKFAQPYFEEKYITKLQEEQDYYYENNMLIVVDTAFEKVLASELSELKNYLKKEYIITDYNNIMFEQNYLSMVKNTNTDHWYMETISFYPNGKHELGDIDFDRYNISKFSDLPKDPVFVEKKWGERSWRQYELSRISGTVLGRNDSKHIIDVLTSDNEVVSIKFYGGQYAYYKQRISEINDGEKTVLDDSWFKRGTLLLISGYRRDETDFAAKKYKNSIYSHSVIKVNSINSDGSLELQLERYNGETDEEIED